ncbi:MAG: helix-turn-helix domain-containing protein [Actinomycetota bacterium]|nr:helix-turn-helix domain-containing protein [Actinomycetota bacterium]
MSPAALIRNARLSARLTQAQLASRLGTSQPVVARLESPAANPTVATLERALQATGHGLVLRAQPRAASVDESLIRKHLELTPSQRLEALETMYREARQISAAGERARGHLA